MNNYYISFFEGKMPKKVMKNIWMMFVSVFLMAGVLAAETDGTFYTDNFYIFLGLIVLFVLIVVIFAWFWFRGPVNKWKK